MKTKKSKAHSKWLDIPAYRSWARMKQRCLNENHEHYHYYGGRGITVYNKWLDFANFYQDMGNRPENLTLERIDNNGNYEPSNCEWATLKKQANNKRSNILLVYNGLALTLTQWADKTGIKIGTLQYRTANKYPVKEILNSNLYGKHKTITYNGICLTIKQWAKRIGINRTTLKSRLNYGWSVKKALTTL